VVAMMSYIFDFEISMREREHPKEGEIGEIK
jgi:hypothetical protein